MPTRSSSPVARSRPDHNELEPESLVPDPEPGLNVAAVALDVVVELVRCLPPSK